MVSKIFTLLVKKSICAFINGISPIGTKFSPAGEEGPQGEKNIYNGELLKGTIYFRFGL